MTKLSRPSTRRWLGRAATAAVGAVALATAIATAAPDASATVAAHASPASHIVKAGGGRIRLHRIGTVNLRALARADASRERSASAKPSSSHTRVAPLRRLHVFTHGSKASAQHAGLTAARLTNRFAGNVRGERGFDGITAAINGAANSPDVGGVGDVTPPDQALAVGPSTAGTAIVEYVNDTLNIYSPSGKTLLGAIPGYQIFGLPSSAFLSDPRAYRDPKSGHWFLTQFIFGDGTSGSPLSTQFIAVSQTTSPFGPYTTFSIDTSDSSNTAGECPCFGDFDQVGMDNSGFYISTNEFSVDGSAFNGTVIYAISKSALISAAQSFASPVAQTYVVPFASDSFGAYHLSPSVVTSGSSAPNTEYFVESNANLNYGNRLKVYALLHTSVLNTGGRPTLVEASDGTEAYSAPPNAVQESGPTPFGCSVGFCATGSLETDFDAVQEVTYASGRLFAELSTGFNFGTGQNSGVAWFVLGPRPHASSLRVRRLGQGYVESSQQLLYPVIGVNAAGDGYLSFALSSSTRYPSTGYMVFKGRGGPSGPIHIAAKGVNPLDDFSCYPQFSDGQCRYGDYSMSQYYKGRIYMASEYVAPQPRDVMSNWSTRVWDARVP